MKKKVCDATQQQKYPISGRFRRPNIFRAVAVSVCFAGLLAGCGGEDKNADPNTIEITPGGLREEAERQESAPDCKDFYRDGATTTDKMDATMCKRSDGELFIPGTARRTCTDGREVMWNDEGWGFLGEPWHRHSDEASKSPSQDVLDGCPP